MPRATLSELFGFLQCQLLNEFEVCLNRTDAKRKKIKPVMWDDYEAFVIPNISREKWVSYHTDLGSHEAFLMTYVHSKLITEWTEKQRFLAIFVFRAHCRKEVFELVQFAQMQSAGFLEPPLTAFRYDSPMENTMLTYRRAAKAPLLSSAFRAIPPRELPDDDANLVRSIVRRTCALLSVAESIFTTLKDEKLDVSVKYKRMSDKINGTPKLGPHVVMICAAGPIAPTTEPKPGTMMAFATPATSRSPVAIPLGRAWVFLRGSRLRFYLSTRSSTRNAWRKERGERSIQHTDPERG